MYVLLRACSLLPNVHQLTAGDKHQIQISDLLVTVTYGAYHTGGVLNEIQFKHLMAVRRVLKVSLVTVSYIKNV